MATMVCPNCASPVSESSIACESCGQRIRLPDKWLPVTSREVDKAKQRLKGILSGISIDYDLTDTEIGELQKWLGLYVHLHEIEPFRTVSSMLNRFLEDQVIDDSEREELMEWCHCMTDDEPRPAVLSVFIRRFHGILHGIALDRKITEDEITGLNDWLLDNEDLRGHWPFNDAFVLIEKILEDGVVTEEEKSEFMEFCRGFSEVPVPSPEIHDEEYLRAFMTSDTPVCHPITYICDREAEVVFDRRSFCFTGPARSGPRKVFKEMVENLGGRFHNTVTKDLDDLVIGAQSSPCWHYTTYGRKIETVMEERKAGRETIVLFEDDFVFQANEALRAKG